MKKKLATILCLLFSINIHAADRNPTPDNIRAFVCLTSLAALQEIQRQQNLYQLGEMVRYLILVKEARDALEGLDATKK